MYPYPPEIARYAHACVDPISIPSMQTAPHVPAGYPSATQKVVTRGFFSVTIGTGGYGYIWVHPCVANTRDSISYTGSTFAGTTSARGTTAAVTGVSGLAFNTPYNDTTLGTAAGDGMYNMYRIVAVGLKGTCSSSLLNRNGTVYSAMHPRNGDLTNYTIQNLTALKHVTRYNFSTHEKFHNALHSVNRFSMDLTDYNTDHLFPIRSYAPDTAQPYWDYTSGTQASGPAPSLVIIQGTAGTVYDVEYIAAMEFAGPMVNLLATPSPTSDHLITKVQQQIEDTHAYHSNNPHTTPHDVLAVHIGAAAAQPLGDSGRRMLEDGVASDDPLMAAGGLGLVIGSNLLKDKEFMRGISGRRH